MKSANEWRQVDYILATVVAIFGIFTLIDAFRRGYKIYRVSKAWAKEEEEIKEEQVQALKEQLAQEQKSEGTVAQPKQPEQKKKD